jgi:hypothetical protein
VLAQSARSAVILLGAMWLSGGGFDSRAMFALVAMAMVVYGAASALALWCADWNRR